jgi:Holliday junction resolvase
MAGERRIQKKIINYLKQTEKAYVINGIYTKEGVPDLIVCIRGKFLAIEVKTPSTTKDVSPLQQYNLDRITEIGGYTMVAWSLPMVKQFIKDNML